MKNKLTRIFCALLILLPTFKSLATDLDDAKSIYDAGYSEQISGKVDNALLRYDELIKRFGLSSDTELQVKVAYALIQKSFVLVDKNQLDAALACDTEIINRFEKSQDVRLNNLVASAFGDKGIIFNMQNKLDDAITYLDMSIFKNRETIKIMHKLIEASSPPVLIYVTPDYQISSALMLKGIIYSKQNKHDLAIASFDEVIEKFTASNDFNAEDVAKETRILKQQELEKFSQSK